MIDIRVVETHNDAAITVMIEMAKVPIPNYTGVEFADSEAPAPVKSAAHLIVGELYDNRDITPENPTYTKQIFAQRLNPYRAMEI